MSVASRMRAIASFVLRNCWSDFAVDVELQASSHQFREQNGSSGSSNGFEAAERARGYASKDFIVW